MMSERKAVPSGERSGPAVEQRGGVWRIRSVRLARDVLRARTATTQAGFTAEYIPTGVLRHHPILISDGPLHDDQRSKVGRFLAPKVVAERYTGCMEAAADRLLAEADARGEFRLDELALLYTVEVTAALVGLTETPVPKLARRLEAFFTQPPFDITKPDLGRTKWQWLRAAVNGLGPVIRLHLRDVRPAIRARRRAPRRDIISHLIAEDYTDLDILVECVTYATAGMVTTREFICMAAWHLLGDDRLRERYLSAAQPERFAILNEIIRLEPVVGHLYRRVAADLDIEPGRTARPGELIDLCVREANADPEVVGAEPDRLCPGRPLPPGVSDAVLSFGDGAHKCPGQPLAILESDILLTRLLARPVTIASEPTIGWDDLIAGYTLRGFRLRR